jgi:hypothetical protein
MFFLVTVEGQQQELSKRWQDVVESFLEGKFEQRVKVVIPLIHGVTVPLSCRVLINPHSYVLISSSSPVSLAIVFWEDLHFWYCHWWFGTRSSSIWQPPSPSLSHRPPSLFPGTLWTLPYFPQRQISRSVRYHHPLKLSDTVGHLSSSSFITSSLVFGTSTPPPHNLGTSCPYLPNGPTTSSPSSTNPVRYTRTPTIITVLV